MRQNEISPKTGKQSHNFKKMSNTNSRKSLSIKPKENFNYVYARSTYIIIDVKDNKTKDLVKKYLTPYIKPVGTLIRFKVNGAMESWLKVSRDIDLTALENYISGVSDK